MGLAASCAGDCEPEIGQPGYPGWGHMYPRETGFVLDLWLAMRGQMPTGAFCQELANSSLRSLADGGPGMALDKRPLACCGKW